MRFVVCAVIHVRSLAFFDLSQGRGAPSLTIVPLLIQQPQLLWRHRPFRCGQSQMLKRRRCHHASAWGALQEAELQQERLNRFLNRVARFGYDAYPFMLFEPVPWGLSQGWLVPLWFLWKTGSSVVA